MALSDYDLLAVTETGEPSTGVFTSPEGVVVEVYKNYLVITDPAARIKPPRAKRGQPRCAPEPARIVVRDGTTSYRGVHVFAERDRSGERLYALVLYGHEAQEWRDPSTGKISPARVQQGMAVTARYGWAPVSEPPFVAPPAPAGVTRQARKDAAELRRLRIAYTWAENGYPRITPPPPYTATWEGVTGADMLRLRQTINRAVRQGEAAQKWRRLDLSKALRFNQGDAYFAAHIDGISINGTPPGEPAPEPLLLSMA